MRKRRRSNVLFYPVVPLTSASLHVARVLARGRAERHVVTLCREEETNDEVRRI